MQHNIVIGIISEASTTMISIYDDMWLEINSI